MEFAPLQPDVRELATGGDSFIFDAIRERLGLKLGKSAKEPVEVLIIDRAEKPVLD